MRTAACLPLLTVLAAVSPAAAQLAPLQASVATQVAGDAGASRELFATLDGGMARVHARITNRDDLRTATAVVRFTYTVPPDTIALDEIVDRIAVAVRTAAGERFSRASLDPHEINLNPNSSSLAYRLTLYRPAGAYRVRIRVFGNYE
jgi:hypothetical protein